MKKYNFCYMVLKLLFLFLVVYLYEFLQLFFYLVESKSQNSEHFTNFIC